MKYSSTLVVVYLLCCMMFCIGCSDIDYPTSVLDTSPYDMSGGSIVINDGAQFAYSQMVEITCSVSNAVQMQFSTDGINYSGIEPFAQSTQLILPLVYGPQTVYGKFFNSRGESIVYSDSVFFIERLIYNNGQYVGGAVAISDDGAVVAAGSYEGNADAVYVFRKQAVDWDCTVLQPDDVQPGDKFGYSVALSGDSRWLFAGAPVKKAVYVYEYNDGWQLRQVIVKNLYNTFGYLISTDNYANFIAVISYDANRYDIFKRDGTSFSTYLSVSYNTPRLYSVVISADASLRFVSICNNNVENVGVYQLSSGNLICYITSPSSKIDYYGTSMSVSADGSMCVIGAPGYDIEADDDKGCFYVYKKSGNSYTLIAQEKNTMGAPGDALGKAVSISPDGQYIVASLPFADEGGTDRGKVLVYRVNGTAIELVHTLYPDDKANTCYYGVALSASNNGVIAIGSPRAYLNTESDNKGVVYIRRLE